MKTNMTQKTMVFAVATKFLPLPALRPCGAGALYNGKGGTPARKLPVTAGCGGGGRLDVSPF